MQEPAASVLRLARLEDLGPIIAIYNQSIQTGYSTSETEPVSVASRVDWFLRHGPESHPLWVLEQESRILGWAGLQPYYGDAAFGSTAEVSIHVAEDARRQGHGSAMLAHVIGACPQLGIRTLLGFAFAHNVATARLNQRHGLHRWGIIPEVATVRGRLFDLVIYGHHPSAVPAGRLGPARIERVARHYDLHAHDEATRLDCVSPLERDLTLRCLERWLPPAAVVADVGVGGGHYAEALARRGHALFLCDISERLLAGVCRRLEEAGLAGQVQRAVCASATDLSVLANASCEAVLLLGPLYHLVTSEDRQRAVSEAHRILKAGGVIFAAGINRLAYFRDLLLEDPTAIIERLEFHGRLLKDGILEDAFGPRIGWAHLTSVGDFSAEFSGHFEELALLGLESFAAIAPRALEDVPAACRELWLDLVEQTSSSPSGRAAADHFLFVGRK